MVCFYGCIVGRHDKRLILSFFALHPEIISFTSIAEQSLPYGCSALHAVEKAALVIVLEVFDQFESEKFLCLFLLHVSIPTKRRMCYPLIILFQISKPVLANSNIKILSIKY